MKVLIFIFACFFFHEISAFSANRIKGLEGIVQVVRFDSAGNIYAVLDDNSVRSLYKLNPSKEILWTLVFPSSVTYVYDIHVTNSNDIYFTITQKSYSYYYFAILKSNSSTIEIVEKIDSGSFFFIDADENLFYSKNSGVQVFKPKSNKSVTIKNLEDFYVGSNKPITADKSGNVYAGSGNYLAFISKESLTEDVPSATLIKISEECGESIQSLTIDERNDFWITLGDFESKAALKKLASDGTLKTVAVDDNHGFLELVFAKDKVFVVAAEFDDRTNNSNVLYVMLDDNEVVEIPELTNITMDALFIDETADSEGNVYIYSFVEISPSLGTMFLIKQNETEPIPIKFNSTQSSSNGIVYVDIDYNLDKWIFGLQGLFYLKQGEIVAENVNAYLPHTCKDPIGVVVFTFINFVGKEIYFSCLNGGLYVVVQD